MHRRVCRLLAAAVMFIGLAPARGQAIDRSPEALRQRLQELVQKLVADGKHYGPGVLWVEDHKKIMWFQGQAVAMMAYAYPYAAEADKPAFAAYLRREVADYLLNPQHISWEISGTLTRPGNEVLKWSNAHANGWMAVYGIWAYANATGDWALLKKNAAAVVELCESLRTPPTQIVASRNTSVPIYNAQYSGAFAMGQIARQLGNDALAARATEAMASARAMMLNKIDQRITISAGGDGNLRYSATLDCMTPQAAAVYATEAAAREQIAAIIANVDETLPFWFMNGLNLGGAGGEGSFQPPQFATQIFLAKAWILGEPYERLAEQLPWPNVYATMPSYRDLQYLQNLAACLRAAAPTGGAR